MAEDISWIFHDSFQDMTEFKDSEWRGFLPDLSCLALHLFENGRCFRQTVRFFCFVIVAIIVFSEPPIYIRLAANPVGVGGYK